MKKVKVEETNQK